MTHEEISKYRINLREKVRANEIVFDIRNNDKEFPNSRITRVFERVGKTSRLNLIAKLIDLDYKEIEKPIIREKQDLCPLGYNSFSSKDLKKNINKAKKMRKVK
ncbi:MAG: hypothetical protein WC917_03900 [Bacilli bacterium]